MAKLSQLINNYTVTTSYAQTPLDALDLKFYPEGSQKWLATILTTSGRVLVVELFYPKTHVIKPSDNKYYPRYGADTSVETPGSEGTRMEDEWWFKYGQPRQPRVDEVASRCADLTFYLQQISSFDDYCEFKGFSNDSLSAYQMYQKDLALLASLKIFLDDTYDLFVNAEVDL